MTEKVDKKSAPADAGKMLEEALKYHDLGYSVIPIHTIIKGKCSCKNPKCSAPGKHAFIKWTKYQRQRADAKQIKRWLKNWPKANIGIVTGKVSGITVLDIDGEEGIKSLEEAGYKVEDFNTPTVKTGGGGYHLYFKYNESIKSKGGVLKKVDVKSESGLVVAPPSFHASGNNYQWLKRPEEYGLEDFPLDLIKANEEKASSTIKNGNWYERLLGGVAEGERNVAATKLAGRYFKFGISKNEVKKFLEAWNQKNRPPLNLKELYATIDNIHTADVNKKGAKEQDIAPWRDERHPADIDKAAFYGLAGEITEFMAEKSEAHPVSILLSFLAILGNMFGPGPHFRVIETRHRCNIFVVPVGETSKARKGMSLDMAISVFCKPSKERGKGRIKLNLDDIHGDQALRKKLLSGLSTGEGLIKALSEEDLSKEIVILETELDRTFAHAENRNLFPVLRQCYDGPYLSLRTRGQPLYVDGAYVSLIGHTTKTGLHRFFPKSEWETGTANRIIWAWVFRPKKIPNPEPLDRAKLNLYREKIQDVIKFAKETGEMTKSPEAERIWADLYDDLISKEYPGSIGAILRRGEPNILRLSMIYALTDKSRVIKPKHLYAALAIWKYNVETVKYVFKDVGSVYENKILNYLEESGQQWVKRSELTKAGFSNKYDKKELDKALMELKNKGEIEYKKDGNALWIRQTLQ